MSSIVHMVLLSLFLSMFITQHSEAANSEKQWCIADEQMPDGVLQEALDWACNFMGADCRMIEPNNPCYLPNTVKDHASYAFNSYWQKFKNKGGSCNFDSAAMVTNDDPSHGQCDFESLP